MSLALQSPAHPQTDLPCCEHRNGKDHGKNANIETTRDLTHTGLFPWPLRRINLDRADVCERYRELFERSRSQEVSRFAVVTKNPDSSREPLIGLRYHQLVDRFLLPVWGCDSQIGTDGSDLHRPSN
jgi:hypothetical protein